MCTNLDVVVAQHGKQDVKMANPFMRQVAYAAEMVSNPVVQIKHKLTIW